MSFITDYYLNYFRYIEIKKRIRVSSFWNIINVFELVSYLENSVSQLGSSTFWILWKEPNIVWTVILLNMIFDIDWSFDIDWYEIESEPFDYALDPANGGKRWHRN